MSYEEEYFAIANDFEQGNKEQAYKNFENFIKKYPYRADALVYLSNVEYGKNNLNKAIELMKKATDIIPFYKGYKYLSMFYIEKRDMQNALKYLKMAFIYNPYCQTTKQLLQQLFPKEKFIINKKYDIDSVYTDSSKCPSVKYTEIYPAGHITRKMPKIIEHQLTPKQKGLIDYLKANYPEVDYVKQFVAEIKNAKFFTKQTDQAYYITEDNKVLMDLVNEFAPKLTTTNFPQETYIGKNVLSLISACGGNYYHWLTWVVPRLWMVKKAGYNIKDFDKIVINFVGFKYQHELLEMLDIPRHKIIGTLENGAVLSADKIVTASLPCYKKTPPFVYDVIREMLLTDDVYDETSPKKIYLSRLASTQRRILNDEDVKKFLISKGFTCIYAEDYTVKEQIKLFANADVVIGQHGAGLANLIFSKPNTKVIEIFNDTFKENIDTGYFRICSDLNLDHYFMFGEAKENTNMDVDINKLSEMLEFADIK